MCRLYRTSLPFRRGFITLCGHLRTGAVSSIKHDVTKFYENLLIFQKLKGEQTDPHIHRCIQIIIIIIIIIIWHLHLLN